MVKQNFYSLYKTTDNFDDIILVSDGECLCGLYFLNDNQIDTKNCILNDDLQIFVQTKDWLDKYFFGKFEDYTYEYKLPQATSFRKRVWALVENIPYGKTTTYGQIAQTIASEKGIKKMSAQAVGNAVGKNPICIIVPCHRVLGKNGDLVGYGGGLKNKIELLKLENIIKN